MYVQPGWPAHASVMPGLWKSRAVITSLPWGTPVWGHGCQLLSFTSLADIRVCQTWQKATSPGSPPARDKPCWWTSCNRGQHRQNLGAFRLLFRSPAATAPARGGWGVWPGARLEQEMLGERKSAAEQWKSRIFLRRNVDGTLSRGSHPFLPLAFGTANHSSGWIPAAFLN